MIPIEKTVRVRAAVMRGCWFAEIQADKESYAILRRRNEDQYADLMTGRFK